MSGLPTTETGIVASAFFLHWVGYDILDLGSGFVNILLPIGLVLYLSVLPSTSLLHWLTILPSLELALVIIIGRLVAMYKLVLSLSAMRALFIRVWKSRKSNILSVHRRCWFNPPRNLSIFLSSVATS